MRVHEVMRVSVLRDCSLEGLSLANMVLECAIAYDNGKRVIATKKAMVIPFGSVYAIKPNVGIIYIPSKFEKEFEATLQS